MRFLFGTLVKFSVILTCIVLFACIMTAVCKDAITHFKGINEEDDQTFLQKFWNRFYFSVVTVSSTGYGDVVPLSNTAKSLTIAIILVVMINVLSIIEPLVYLKMKSMAGF
jgi:Ion channel